MLTRSSSIVLASSFLAATITAQADWSQVKPTQLPPARSDHLLVADNIGLIFFGGRPQPGNYVINDTWRYIGNTWTQMTPASSPSGRWHARAAFDSRRGRIVLFGGRAPNNVFFGDTWELVGTNWQQMTPATSPSSRERCGLVFDEKRNEVVLFGGRDASVLGDMWTYNGTTWTQKIVTPLPSARWHPVMVYDSDREVVVLFGGNTGTAASTALDDTWEWNGVQWQKMSPTTSPPKTYTQYADYDAARQRVVMFGGLDNTSKYLDTTWEYDGTTWAQRMPATSPPSRSGGPVAYVPSQRTTFLYGGFDPTIKQLSDFWSYKTASFASWSASGSGCKGAAGTPALSASSLPWTGDKLDLSAAPVAAATPTLFILGFSKTSWMTIPLPLPLAGVGAQGCSLYTDMTLMIPAVNANGGAVLSLPIPTDTSLAGLDIYNQAMLYEPSSNALGLVFSDLGEAKIGVR